MKQKKKNNEQPADTKKADAKPEGQEVVLPNVVPAELEAMVSGKLRLFEKTASRKQRKWLTAYALTGQLVKASELSGVDWRSHYYWKKTDLKYALLFDQAREIALDLAESEVFRRGIAGYEKYLSYKGKRGDKVVDYSDNLAMFFLKGYRGHFRDGIGGFPVGPQIINLSVTTTPIHDVPELTTPRTIEVNSRPVLSAKSEAHDGDDDADLKPSDT